MKNTQRKVAIVTIIITCSICLKFALLDKTGFSQTDNNSSKSNTAKMSTTDPCSIISLEGVPDSGVKTIEYEKRMRRETFGYTTDIALDEAIKIFNDEAKCNSRGKNQPPLTREEVITAAFDLENLAGNRGSATRKAALEKIFREKVMPKGSLLVYESGHHQPDKRDENRDIHVQYWKIYVYLGLDKNPREANPLNREQICLIRQAYLGVEIK